MLPELIIDGMNPIPLYSVFDALAGLSVLLYILFHTVKYRDFLPVTFDSVHKKTLLAFLELVFLSASLYGLLFFLNRLFATTFTSGNANYYGNLTAWLIVLILSSLLFRFPFLHIMDLLSPCMPLSLSVAKFACIFNGCCSGFEMTDSWYFNQNTGRHEFPVQLVESIIAVILFLFLRWYQKRNVIPGSVFPAYLTLYSASRFMTEFLRADFPNVLGPFDAYQIMSAVFFLFGILLFYSVWIYKLEKDRKHSKR